MKVDQMPHSSPLAAQGSIVAASVVIAVAVGVLAGWFFGIEPLMTILPGYIRMKPNTAIAFIAAALAVILHALDRAPRIRNVAAAITASIGAATLFQYFTGVQLHIDQMLFNDSVQKIHPGRMAHVTAFNFVFIGSALLLGANTVRRSTASGILACMVMLGSLFAIVGYAYGVPVLYGSMRHSSMAFHTGVSFLLLSIAVVFHKPQGVMASLFFSGNSGGIVARRLIPTAVIVPIVLGALFVRPEFSFGHMRLGLALSVMSGVVLHVLMIGSLSRSLSKSYESRIAAERASTIDGLTGIFNRRAFDQRMEEEIARSRRYGNAFSVLLLDVDHFKKVNDQHGHLAGDEVLRELAAVAKKAMRPSDIFCRYGGEEFAIIATGTTMDETCELAERVGEAVRSHTVDAIGRPVTISMGLTEWRRGDLDASALISRADAALYEAKAAGRDCLRAATSGLRAVPREIPQLAPVRMTA